MNSVKFGDKDSLKDWGLILNPKSRPLPSPKTNYISIEGRDGDLDLTTSLTGDVKYKDINYTMGFTLLDKREDWETKLYEISTYLHGKKMKVIFSDDPDWYYVGRMALNELTSDRNIGNIQIDCIFEPYKLKVQETIINEPIEAGKVITLSNSRKWVMPTFNYIPTNIVDFSDGECSSGVSSTFENDVLTLTGDGANKYQHYSVDVTEFVKNNPNKHLYFSFENIEAINIIDGTLVQLNVKTDGKYNYTHMVMNNQNRYGYIIPNDTSKITAATIALYTTNSSSSSNANTVYFTKPMLQVGNQQKEYEPHIDSASFIIDNKQYTFDNVLKTPDIILKENNTEITLASNSGNIEISYREGKL